MLLWFLHTSGHDVPNLQSFRKEVSELLPFVQRSVYDGNFGTESGLLKFPGEHFGQVLTDGWVKSFLSHEAVMFQLAINLPKKTALSGSTCIL
jgi:hypothetical protein